MRTDPILHQMLVQMPSLVFVLIGRDAEESKHYTFSSVEVKETAFRLDGVLIPDSSDGTIYVVELQFQHDDRFYSRLFAELFVYLRRNESDYDWQAVVVFAEEHLDTGIPKQYRELEGRVRRIYLDRLSEEQTAQHPVDIVELLILPRNIELVGRKARAVLERATRVQTPLQQQETIKLVIQILTQKFSTLSYEEAQMLLDLNIPTFEETQFYKDILQRGEQQGEQQGERNKTVFTVERMLREGLADEVICRIANVSPEELTRIKQQIVL